MRLPQVEVTAKYNQDLNEKKKKKYKGAASLIVPVLFRHKQGNSPRLDLISARISARNHML